MTAAVATHGDVAEFVSVFRVAAVGAPWYTCLMPKTHASKSGTLTIRLGPRTRATAERYAKARDMSLGEFLRYAAQVYFDSTPEDPDDLGSEATEFDREA